MFIYNIGKQGNNVDMNKWTPKNAVIYGAVVAICFYMFLWIYELVCVFIFGY